MKGIVRSRLKWAGTTVRRRAIMLSACVCLILLLAGSVPAFAGAAPSGPLPIDGTPQVELASQHGSARAGILGPSTTQAPRHAGRAADITLDLPDLSSQWVPPYDSISFWKEWSGRYADVYVAWNDLAAPPGTLQQSQTITPAEIAYIGGEFDRRIWPSDVFHFGRYAARPAASSAGKRIAVMIYNIRDDAYYSSSTTAQYVGGYFNSSVDDQAQINAVFLDSYDWPHGTGPNGREPYLYEGTLAHEFAHLIQHDVDPNEQTFVDEGLAELATQFLYGPTATSAEVGEYLVYHRDSLTDWKSELFDYGDAALWQDYLWEQAGGGVLADPVGQAAPAARRVARGHSPDEDSAAKFADPGDRFVWQLAHDPATGLDSIADQLPGGRAQVEQEFRDWTLANLLDGQVSEPQWNYRNLALGGPDSSGRTIADGVQYYDAGVAGNLPPTRGHIIRSAIVQPWGAYYETYRGVEPGVTVTFSGPAAVGVLPPTGTYEWYCGGTPNDPSQDDLWRTLQRRIDGAKPGDQLTFWTWYDIEQGSDFGYVEASHDGKTWKQLSQLSSLPADGGALTGASGTWQKAAYSLTGFTGTVYVRFRYATDFALTGEGWYIDDIALATFVDPVAVANGWVAGVTTDTGDPVDYPIAGWALTTGVKQTNDWTADVYVPHQWGQQAWSAVTPVVGVAGQGLTGRATVDTQFLKNGALWAVVSNHPDGTLDSTASVIVQKGR
jgi:hypothetical protein